MNLESVFECDVYRRETNEKVLAVDLIEIRKYSDWDSWVFFLWIFNEVFKNRSNANIVLLSIIFLNETNNIYKFWWFLLYLSFLFSFSNIQSNKNFSFICLMCSSHFFLLHIQKISLTVFIGVFHANNIFDNNKNILLQ